MSSKKQHLESVVYDSTEQAIFNLPPAPPGSVLYCCCSTRVRGTCRLSNLPPSLDTCFRYARGWEAYASSRHGAFRPNQARFFSRALFFIDAHTPQQLPLFSSCIFLPFLPSLAPKPKPSKLSDAYFVFCMLNAGCRCLSLVLLGRLR